MNLLLLEQGAVQADGHVVVTGRQAKHMAEILKVQEGSTIRVGIDNTWIGTARIEFCETVSRDAKALQLNSGRRCPVPNEYRFRLALLHTCGTSVNAPPTAMPPPTSQQSSILFPGRPRVDILLAMPRPKVFDKILQTCATLGVGRIVITPTARVEGAYFSSPKLSNVGISEALRLGLEQSATDPLFPEVHVFASWKRCLQEVVAKFTLRHRVMLNDSDAACGKPGPTEAIPGKELPYHKLIAFHPDDKAPFVWSESLGVAAHIRQNHGPVLIAIGPEGGFIDLEIEDLQKLGFSVCQLGSRILKVETALVTVLAQITMLLQKNTITESQELPIREDITPITTLPCWCSPESTESRSIRIALPVRGRDMRKCSELGV